MAPVLTKEGREGKEQCLASPVYATLTAGLEDPSAATGAPVMAPVCVQEDRKQRLAGPDSAMQTQGCMRVATGTPVARREKDGSDLTSHLVWRSILGNSKSSVQQMTSGCACDLPRARLLT